MDLDNTGFLYEPLAPIMDGSDTVFEQSASSSDPASRHYKSEEEDVEDDDEAAEIEYISLGGDEEEEVEAEKDEALLNLAEDSVEQAAQVWPWIQARAGTTFKSPLLQLHQEILDFCKFISPTEEERRERSLAVARVSDCIKSLWPHCKVEVFGSFATGLYLPSSDVDMVIMDSGCVVTQNGLKALAKMLRKRNLAKKLVVIAKARVPIVKFTEADSGISFDISFDVKNGPEAAKFIQQAISSLPPLRPLCMVLKIFLQQRELNEVYTGGVGSYALLVMILTHLQLHPSRQSYGPLEANLGVLLLDFLDLYGRALNVREVGISCAKGGRFFSKVSRGFYDQNRPFLLAVEDPQAPENDIGKNSYNVVKVRAAFVLAHKLLTSSDTSFGNVGILGRIIRNDEKLTNRKSNMINEPVSTYFFNDNSNNKDHNNKNNKNEKKNKQNRNRFNQEEYREHRKRKRPEYEYESAQTGYKERKMYNKKNMENGSTFRRSQKEKWRRVEDEESPRISRRTTYIDHYDHGRIDNKKKVIMASASHKKIKYLS